MAESIEKLPIPKELCHPLFFPEKEVTLDPSDNFLVTGKNFYFEILFYNGIKGDKPWASPDLFIPQIHEEWSKVKHTVEELHHQRKKNRIIEEMKKGIGLFLQFLYWSNRKPVCLKGFPNNANLELMPVNLKERAEFIIARPNLYHSFVQLCELMNEQEKVFAKNNAIKKTR